MKIQLKEIGSNPVFSYKTFDILCDGQVVGKLTKGSDRRWNAVIIRNIEAEYSLANQTSFHHSNFNAISRIIACRLLGEVKRLPYLQRGIWTNPCPNAELI